MARRGRQLPDLRISAPSVVARIWARACDGTDFRPSMNGVGGACASRHTVWESSREPWRDGAGRLPDLKISAPSVVARILVWASDATDFRPSRNGVGGACASRRTVCESVGGRSRAGAVFSQTSGIRSQSCLHTRRRGRSTGPIFDHRGSGLAAAHGLRERGRAIARRRSLFADFGYPVTIMLAHIAAWAVEGADFRPSRSGSGSGLAAAHGLRECGRAITRRRGLFADVGDSLSSRT